MESVVPTNGNQLLTQDAGALQQQLCIIAPAAASRLGRQFATFNDWTGSVFEDSKLQTSNGCFSHPGYGS